MIVILDMTQYRNCKTNLSCRVPLAVVCCVASAVARGACASLTHFVIGT